jgi:hypothetical protein
MKPLPPNSLPKRKKSFPSWVKGQAEMFPSGNSSTSAHTGKKPQRTSQSQVWLDHLRRTIEIGSGTQKSNKIVLFDYKNRKNVLL